MRVLGGLAERAERAASARASARIERMAEVVRSAGGIDAERRGDALVLRGRGLVRRWLSDGELRFAMWRRG